MQRARSGRRRWSGSTARVAGGRPAASGRGRRHRRLANAAAKASRLAGSVDRSRTNTPRDETSEACTRANAGVTDTSVAGSAQVGARVIPTTRTRANPPSGCPKPCENRAISRASSRRRMISSPTWRPRSAAAGSLTRISSAASATGARPLITTGSARPGGWSGPPLSDTNRTAGVLIWATHATGVQLSVTPGIVGIRSKTVLCAAGSRTCASATPTAAPSRS